MRFVHLRSAAQQDQAKRQAPGTRVTDALQRLSQALLRTIHFACRVLMARLTEHGCCCCSLVSFPTPPRPNQPTNQPRAPLSAARPHQATQPNPRSARAKGRQHLEEGRPLSNCADGDGRLALRLSTSDGNLDGWTLASSHASAWPGRPLARSFIILVGGSFEVPTYSVLYCTCMCGNGTDGDRERSRVRGEWLLFPRTASLSCPLPTRSALPCPPPGWRKQNRGAGLAGRQGK